MIEVLEANTDDLIAKAKELFQEYAESLGIDLCFQNFAQELNDFPGQYSAPAGRLYLARHGKQFIGCVGLRCFKKDICEMKRLYVRPNFRGKQAGRALAEASIRAAEDIGYHYMRLDTLPSMESAHKLYRSLGFRQIEPYRHNPIEGAVYMELKFLNFSGAKMTTQIVKALPQFLEIFGLDEEPMGLFYTDEKPPDGFSPKPNDLPTREKEMKNEIDWQKVFGEFSCVMGHIWRARKKKATAYFCAEQFGCPGGAFWMGFNKPQTETIINYVSTGIAHWTAGERYCDSPDELRRIFQYVDPRPAPRKYCVVKPIGNFSGDEVPELVAFFTRPESLSGLHQLAAFVTNDPEVVVSPWGAGCGNVVAWPLHYLSKGQNRAVIGGWDPSARKFFKTDELSFTVPYKMFLDMLNRFNDSFLMTKAWATVQKKIERSKKAWKEA